MESKNIDFIMFEGISTIGEQLNFDFNERKFKTFLNQSYRENLLKKLGYEEFERLTIKSIETRKFTREELKEIISVYKEKIKQLTNECG